jgi:hypothetical protein
MILFMLTETVTQIRLYGDSDYTRWAMLTSGLQRPMGHTSKVNDNKSPLRILSLCVKPI